MSFLLRCFLGRNHRSQNISVSLKPRFVLSLTYSIILYSWDVFVPDRNRHIHLDVTSIETFTFSCELPGDTQKEAEFTRELADELRRTRRRLI